MKKRAKIILAVSIILISYFSYSGIDYHLRQQRIAAKEKKAYNEQLAFYADFLKPDIVRADVERELRRRSIPFETYSVDRKNHGRFRSSRKV